MTTALALRTTDDGEALLLKVRAAPGASRSALAGLHGDALKVRVSAPPEKGRANKAIAEVLARALGLRASRVRIWSGETSRDKWFRIEGLRREDLLERLQGRLG